jgi:hypothetical protein
MLSSNTKHYCFLFLLLYCLLYSSNAYSIKTSTKTIISIPLDSSKVNVRKLNDEAQKKLLANKDYQYDKIGPAPKSLWERFWNWFWRQVGKIFDSKEGNIGWHIFEYLLIAAVIVLIVFLLMNNDIRFLFYGKSASVPIDFREFEEDINKINFDDLIQDALSKKDFRKAVRLHFLKLLKELTDNNIIKGQIDKTNNDYSMELANSRYNSSFKELALLYEYVWYGDFQLDETNFKTTILKFKDFKVES